LVSYLIILVPFLIVNGFLTAIPVVIYNDAENLGILIFTGAGIVTPTIDGFTQLSFSFLAFSLYILVIIVMTRRLNVKYIETSTFGS
jgi:hypothetical protein